MESKRLRDTTWEDYGISKFRYRELKNFCLQYEEKKKKINRGMSSPKHDGMPGGSRCIKSPVENQAIENVMNLKDIRMIEEAAVAADPTVWCFLIKSVTQDMPYEYIQYNETGEKIPMCRNDFYGTRRYFFFILHKLKLGYKSTDIL